MDYRAQVQRFIAGGGVPRRATPWYSDIVEDITDFIRDNDLAPRPTLDSMAKSGCFGERTEFRQWQDLSQAVRRRLRRTSEVTALLAVLPAEDGKAIAAISRVQEAAADAIDALNKVRTSSPTKKARLRAVKSILRALR